MKGGWGREYHAESFRIPQYLWTFSAETQTQWKAICLIHHGGLTSSAAAYKRGADYILIIPGLISSPKRKKKSTIYSQDHAHHNFMFLTLLLRKTGPEVKKNEFWFYQFVPVYWRQGGKEVLVWLIFLRILKLRDPIFNHVFIKQPDLLMLTPKL